MQRQANSRSGRDSARSESFGSPSEARGFSLTELLLAMAIISILASIIIPSLLNALDRGRQKRTMADIRLLANGVESYSVDNSTYPVGTGIGTLTALQPIYVDPLIARDGWNHDLLYSGAAEFYTLGSAGKNGGATLVVTGGGGATHSFDDDIVYAVGSFVQWPEGMQE